MPEVEEIEKMVVRGLEHIFENHYVGRKGVEYQVYPRLVKGSGLFAPDINIEIKGYYRKVRSAITSKVYCVAYEIFIHIYLENEYSLFGTKEFIIDLKKESASERFREIISDYIDKIRSIHVKVCEKPYQLDTTINITAEETAPFNPFLP